MESSIYTAAFWKAAAERAVKTFAQSAVASLTVVATAGGGITDAGWLTIASVSGLAAVISILTSVGSGMATGGGPSATNSETIPESGD